MTFQLHECDECGAVSEIDDPTVKVMEALRKVANAYGCVGTREHDLISDAFKQLADELEK